MSSDQPPPLLEGTLPFDDDAVLPDQLPGALGPFRFIGKGLTADQFSAYVQDYDFGSIPPDYVVLHHTAIPSTAYAHYPSGWTWDTDEAGMDENAIYASRAKKIVALRDHYSTLPPPKGPWDRGPHLFIDDRYIWLFSPMDDWGIHAAEGNRYTGTDGKFHYSIGIEVVGYYERTQWPPAVEALVGHAVAVLKERLGTFDIRHQRFAGGISAHRDYNKPECPGTAISESYYLGVLQAAVDRLHNGSATFTATSFSLTTDSPIIGGATGAQEQVVRFVTRNLPAGSEYSDDVATIVSYYWTYGPSVGVDPFLAAVQCVFETDSLRSQWASRPHRNPAGLGVHEEGGLSFATWEEAVQAHLGQLLAFALRDDEANDGQRQMMRANPRFDRIAAEQRGTVKTVAALNGTWSSDGDYANKLIARAKSVAAS